MANKLSSTELLKELETVIPEGELSFDDAMLLLEKDPTLLDFLKKIFTDNKEVNIDDLRDNIENTSLKNILDVYAAMKTAEVSKDEDLFKKVDTPDISDSVKEYLKEISKYPLLSVEEEKELAKRIADGDEEARKAFINSNLRLVVHNAKYYMNKGLPFLDLIQEGNIGLMKAVDRYDVSMGYKFSTYGTWWIRQSLSRAISEQVAVIRKPVHMMETINKHIRARKQLEQMLTHEPTDEDVAEYLNIPVEKVREVKKYAEAPVSLETPIGEEEESLLIDFIRGEDNVEESGMRGALRDTIEKILQEKKFNDRERYVLYRRFGLGGLPASTLEEVGKDLGVTRERIRQIEARTLRKLRHPATIKKFKDYKDLVY